MERSTWPELTPGCSQVMFTSGQTYRNSSFRSTKSKTTPLPIYCEGFFSRWISCYEKNWFKSKNNPGKIIVCLTYIKAAGGPIFLRACLKKCYVAKKHKKQRLLCASNKCSEERKALSGRTDRKTKLSAEFASLLKAIASASDWRCRVDCHNTKGTEWKK